MPEPLHDKPTNPMLDTIAQAITDAVREAERHARDHNYGKALDAMRSLRYRWGAPDEPVGYRG